MAEPKTKKNEASVEDFLSLIKEPEKQKDSRALVGLLSKVTGDEPKMWGKSIVGFGQFRYRYASGREGDWMVSGFSPRAQNLTLYIMSGFKTLAPLLKKLGKHSTSVSCLYIRTLSDVDQRVLESILRQGVKETRALERPTSTTGTKPKKKAAVKSARAKSTTARKKRAGRATPKA